MAPIGTTNQLALLAKPLGQPTAGAPSNVLGGAAVMAAKNTYKPSAPVDDSFNRYNQELINSNNALLAEMRRQREASYLPYFNVMANYTQARGAAEKAVNPLYQQKLTDYLKQAEVQKQRKQEDFNRNTTQLDEALATNLEASGIARTRTAEDVQNNLSQLATAEGEFQQDSGTNFDKARLSLLRNVGDAGGGMDAQAINEQTAQQNTAEGRQVRSFNVQKDAQNLLKTRTFEDLARSDTLATKQTGQQKDLVKIDLDRYLQDMVTNEANTRNQLELERLQAVLAEQGNQEKLGVMRFLSTLSGNAYKNAAAAYLR